VQKIPSSLLNQDEINSIASKIKDAFSTNKIAPPTTTDFYKIGKLLGKGAFGKVHLGVHKLTGKLVAIKSIKKEFLTNSQSKKKVMQEFSILKLLRHDSIIRLYETFESSKHILFVIELCAGGDLLNYVRKRRKLKENHAKFVFKQIIDGLYYCHQKKILHRDIKLDNILLNGVGDIKICDFGVSKLIKLGEKITEQCGTPAYIAPEILKGAGYEGFESDIWSAGIVLYAILYGTVPFKAGNMHELHKLILTGKYTLKEDISEDARNLLKAMLEINPKKRITIQEIYNHQWLKNIDENIPMFGESEKQSILREFAYQKKDDESSSDCQFTEQNIDSTLNELTKNISTKSNILAPFNSTISHEKFEIQDSQIYPKHKIFKLKGKVKDMDCQYEKNNNCELDNGVYNKFVGNKSNNSSKSSLNNSFEENAGHCQSKESSQVLSSIIRGEEDDPSRTSMAVKITNSIGSFPTAPTLEYSIIIIQMKNSSK
jgi:serine/threonine protein kinase